jgi:hypothetical protein
MIDDSLIYLLAIDLMMDATFQHFICRTELSFRKNHKTVVLRAVVVLNA